MHDIPFIIQLIGAFFALAAAGVALVVIGMTFALLCWLASIPLKLVGILPGIWWGTT